MVHVRENYAKLVLSNLSSTTSTYIFIFLICSLTYSYVLFLTGFQLHFDIFYIK